MEGSPQLSPTGVSHLAELQVSAAQGDPQSLYSLAQFFWTGTHVSSDPARGRLLLEYAAALGHAGANLLVTNLLANGIGGKRDWPTAIARIHEEACELPVRKEIHRLITAMRLDVDGNPTSTPMPLILSERPNVRLYERLLTADECKHITGEAKNLFQPSMVYSSARDGVRDPLRTSDGAALHWLIEDPVIHAINRRIAALTKTSFKQGEALQVLRYAPGQEYRPHFDVVERTANRRIWTALIYLNDAYEGGETSFVRTRLRVRGTVGDVLLFSNVLEDGSRDDLSEHAGLPVISGTKFLATRWIREMRWAP